MLGREKAGVMRLKWTEKDLERKKAAGTIQGWSDIGKKADAAQKAKKSKYNAQRVEYDGILFASTKEKNRYVELKWYEQQGLIRDLRLQVAYELNPGGTHSLKYLADFVYIDCQSGQEIVEDAKGYRTKEYKKKKRLMHKVHGIEIKEV